MTREDAILWLKHINTREFGWDDYAMQDSQKEIRERCEQSVREAIDMAISALSIKPISVRNDGTLFINVLDAEKVHSVVVTDYGFFYKKFCEEVKQEDDSDYINDIPSEYLTEPIDLMSHEEAWEQIESDLISRAEAMAYPLGFDHYDKENGSREFICGVESYREYIQHLPSVSVESKATENKYDCDLISRIVRCKDCEYYDNGENEVDSWEMCKRNLHSTSQYDFCSWAKMKGEK